MNRHRTRGFVELAFVVAAAGPFAVSLPAAASEVFPFEPTVGRFAVKRLEIADGPDPVDNINQLYVKTGPALSLPPMWPDSSFSSTDTAVDVPGGHAAMVWSEHRAGAYRVAIAPITDDGWAAASWMSGPSVVDPRPSAAFLPDGSILLVYVLDDGTQSRAYRRSASPPSGIWTEPEAISLPGEDVTSVHVGVHDGAVHVVYARRDGSTTSIIHATSTGSGLDREVVAVSSFAGDTWPQIHSHAGALWIDWVDAEAPTGAGELAWKRRGAGSDWEPTQYEAYVSPFDREYHVRPGVRLQAIAP